MNNYLTDWLGIIDNHLDNVSPEEMERLYLKIKEVIPVSPTIEEFLIRHKCLREHDETLVIMESPRRSGKSWVEMQLNKQRPAGKAGGISLSCYAKGWTQERKLLQSSSKQSRMVSVVCK